MQWGRQALTRELGSRWCWNQATTRASRAICIAKRPWPELKQRSQRTALAMSSWWTHGCVSPIIGVQHSDKASETILLGMKYCTKAVPPPQSPRYYNDHMIYVQSSRGTPNPVQSPNYTLISDKTRPLSHAMAKKTATPKRLSLHTKGTDPSLEQRLDRMECHSARIRCSLWIKAWRKGTSSKRHYLTWRADSLPSVSFDDTL